MVSESEPSRPASVWQATGFTSDGQEGRYAPGAGKPGTSVSLVAPAFRQLPSSPEMLRYGYTLDDINELVKIAVLRDRGWYQGMDFRDRVEIAWSAALEHLYSCQTTPAEFDLIQAAWTAIRRQMESDISFNGRSSIDASKPARNFYRFWSLLHDRGHEDRVIDRVALWQIMAELSLIHRETLLVYAAHGNDLHRAAASLGIAASTFQVRVSRARRRFFKLWHQHEKPSTLWHQDRVSARREETTRRRSPTWHVRTRKS